MRINFRILLSLAVFFVFSALSWFKLSEIMNWGVKPVAFRSLLQSRNPASSTKGLSVTIPKGTVAYLDESANIDTLTIFGELHCDPFRAPDSIDLKAKTILVYGVFECGTPTQPYLKNVTISLKPSVTDVRIDERYRGIIVGTNGILSLHGNRKNAGWLKLNRSIQPGDQVISVEYAPTYVSNHLKQRSPLPLRRTLAWSIGEQIAIGPTGFNPLEGENFTITAINTSTNEISLDRPVQYPHWGERQFFKSKVLRDFELDERAEVANLSRSILIRADETDGLVDESSADGAQLGGHIMVHSGGQAYLDSIELYKMGQAGIMARYPFHWHYSGDVSGQYIRNSSIHHSYQRCVTVHQTQNAIVQNNTCYHFKGHGYFLEDGNETGNQIIRNLAIGAIAPDTSKRLLDSDDVRPSEDEGQGRFPSVSCFWISNPKNTVKYNVASGCRGVGIWNSFEDKVLNLSGVVIAEPLREATTEFNYNVAHSSQVGITWDGAPGWENANNPNNSKDRKLAGAHYAPPTVPVVTGNVAFKNSMSGIYFRGNSIVFRNSITADNGWSYWVAYNQIIKDSVFIGKTNNSNPSIDRFFYEKSYFNGRLRKSGIVLYDGPFEIHNSDFLNFSTARETYTALNGKTLHTSAVPFTLTGGTNKFVNLTSGLRFNPEPIYRVHAEDPGENPRSRQNLGNASIRDLDGTLTNADPGSSVVATRSLGILSNSGCRSRGDTFYNMKICPPTYAEGSVTFMRWEWSAWSTPFLVRRSDGVFNYLLDEWSFAMSYNNPNNLFALANSSKAAYEVLPLYNFAQDTTNTDPSKWIYSYMDSNAESLNFNPPIIKILAYGNNCRLENGPIRVASLSALDSVNQTAYYSSGKEFYVRIFPKTWWDPITHSPLTQATAYTTMPIRHRINCDINSPIPFEVIGKIESVTRGSTATTISGWACNFTHPSPIKVDLYAIGTSTSIRNAPSLPPVETVTHLQQMTSNLTPDPHVAFKCGKFSTAGRRFQFAIPNSVADQHRDHRVYVKGLSNSTGGLSLYIGNSGRFRFVPRTPDPILPDIR